MNRLSVALIAAVPAIAFAQIASAADMPVKAPADKAPIITPYNWTGFYVGGHLGYLWGRTTLVDNGVVTETNAPTDGVIGGALGGYNWQNGSLVLGVEGDFGWTNAHGNGATFLSTEIFHYDINWTSHIRGRAGYASGPWLAFVAGGAAFAKFDMTMQIGSTIIPCQEGGPFTGWSIGGGVDYAFNDWVSARVEYLYDDFGRKDYVMGVNDVYQVHLTGNTVRGAITFKLWPH
jgi:outer membrane immunogenic protein